MDNTTRRRRLASLALAVALLLPPALSWAAFTLDDSGEPIFDDEAPPDPTPSPAASLDYLCGNFVISLSTGTGGGSCEVIDSDDNTVAEIRCFDGKNFGWAFCRDDGTPTCKDGGKGECSKSPYPPEPR